MAALLVRRLPLPRQPFRLGNQVGGHFGGHFVALVRVRMNMVLRCAKAVRPPSPRLDPPDRPDQPLTVLHREPLAAAQAVGDLAVEEGDPVAPFPVWTLDQGDELSTALDPRRDLRPCRHHRPRAALGPPCDGRHAPAELDVDRRQLARPDCLGSVPSRTMAAEMIGRGNLVVRAMTAGPQPNRPIEALQIGRHGRRGANFPQPPARTAAGGLLLARFNFRRKVLWYAGARRSGRC